MTRRPLLAALLAASVALPAVAAGTDAAAEPERYQLLEEHPLTGSLIKRELLSSPLPFNKRYDELNSEQKGRLRAEYDHMPDADEPPFPVNGLGALYRKLAAAQDRLQVKGPLLMHVQVDAKGVAQSVSVIESPDSDMTKVAAGVLMLESYKPGLCAGQPCAMAFPVRMEFHRRDIR